MTYRGHVEKGVIALDEPAELPEGVAVHVVTAESAEEAVFRSSPAMRHLGTIDDVPPDASVNLDRDLYGHSKPD